MAYTETDLENIERAIMELGTGERIVRVTVGGKTIEYHQTDLDALKSLKSDIDVGLGRASFRTHAKMGRRR